MEDVLTTALTTNEDLFVSYLHKENMPHNSLLILYDFQVGTKFPPFVYQKSSAFSEEVNRFQVVK